MKSGGSINLDYNVDYLLNAFDEDFSPVVQLFDCVNGASNAVELWTCMP